MKRYAIQVGLILLALAVSAGAIYIIPKILHFFPSGSYRFVLFFLLLILMSNILSKISYKYFEV
jgi:hypothetical protein